MKRFAELDADTKLPTPDEASIGVFIRMRHTIRMKYPIGSLILRQVRNLRSIPDREIVRAQSWDFDDNLPNGQFTKI
jgi:hypothetical protein